MQISWLGHACFLLVSESGTRIVADPFDATEFGGEMNYPPIDLSADVVTVSHTTHGDHNYANGVRDRRLVKSKQKETTIDDVKIFGVASHHDRSSGAERGDNTIFVFELDGLVVVHLGDLGHPLATNQVSAIGPKVDVLLCPVGGVFTIGMAEADDVIAQLNPRIVIPMHYKTPDCRIGLDTIDSFVVGKSNVKTLPWTVTVTSDTLPAEPQVWVMDYRKEDDPEP